MHQLPLVVALCVTALSPLFQAGNQSSSSLTIVVIEGEDAINVIQQRTAVAPLVEVRDRNGVPVSGAVVTFSVRSGRAAFSGARTLTVATNAAGRAAATGFTPTGAGTVQIGAAAAFEGQTAVATIVQTNVMTAAEAAGAAGVGSTGAGGGAATSAGGAAAGSGGGLSGTTIGIVGAAVAGGAVVAANAAGGEEATAVSAPGPGTGRYSGTATMTVVDTAQSTGLRNAVGNAGGICTFTRAVAITMTAQLQDNAQGVITMGEFSTRWTETEISKSCPTTTTTGGTFPGSGPQVDDVSGQHVGSLHFDRIDRGSPGGATITFTTSFSGALSGDTIGGTFTLSRTQEGPGDARENRPATSAAITLRRQ